MSDRHVWVPSQEYVDGTRLARVMGWLGVSDYDDFLELGVANSELFWRASMAEIGFEWFTPFATLREPDGDPRFPVWFPGGTTNAAFNAVGRWKGRGAERAGVISVTEDGGATALSLENLDIQSGTFAAGLAQLGVEPGDRVALLLPYDSRAAIAVLACCRAGAIAVPMFTGFGPGAIAQRLAQAECAILVTCPSFVRSGRHIDLAAVAHAAGDRMPTKVAVESYEHVLELGAQESVFQYVAMGANDPLLIAYTSGTSGTPKGAVHTHAGLPLKICQELTQLMNLGQGSVLLRITDLGWVGGPYSILSGLMAGATIVMYSGGPSADGYSRVWRLVEDHDVTHLGISPSFARLARAGGHDYPRREFDLASLYVTSSVGEPWDRATYEWFAERVCGPRVPIVNHCGGTEVGNLLANVPLREIIQGAFNTTVPGVAVDVVDDAGRRVWDAPGNLVVREPFVGMTRGLWHADERYLTQYWSRFCDMWDQGDLAVHTSHDSWALVGRSDDRMKISGRGIMPDEVEAPATRVPGVTAAVALVVPDASNQPRLVVVVETDGSQPDLRHQVVEEICEDLGRAFAPRHVLAVARIPRGQSGKVLRGAITQALTGNVPTAVSDLLSQPDREALKDLTAIDLEPFASGGS